MTLEQFVALFAEGITQVDQRLPVAKNMRRGTNFRPGIGPFGEAATIDLVMAEVSAKVMSGYQKCVPYPSDPRKKCDLCIGTEPNWELAVEMKLLRVMGDNGKSNDSMLMHILSPYPANRSALTDCAKLAQSGFRCPKAIVIYGYDYEDWPMEKAIAAFERLAGDLIEERTSAKFSGLVHPVHQRGAVYGWLLRQL